MLALLSKARRIKWIALPCQVYQTIGTLASCAIPGGCSYLLGSMGLFRQLSNVGHAE